MKTRRILSLALALVLVLTSMLAFASCDKADDGKYTVGIVQLVQHSALDDATRGFRDALVEELGEENIEFLEQNANGEPTVCTTIVNDFVTKNVDLIMANATAALQAAANGTQTIPVLGTSVTDYATALEIDDYTGIVGTNVSGTSDLAPLDAQADIILELFPDTKSVALLYCSAEPNSKYQIDVVREYLEGKGLTCEEFAFADSNDVASVSAAAAAAADVIYIPTDNTAASCTEAINGAVLPTGTPIVGGDEGICGGCGVATIAISYYDLGVKTGKMAAQVLKGEIKVEETPIASADNPTKKYNPVNCEALNITIPEDYVALG
ncbi:MAG: ABC transporter substrate-binding protein [Clostridia bacterium]|nr:ABC transporter substrate-binding protein [Clostridia bacterium]